MLKAVAAPAVISTLTRETRVGASRNFLFILLRIFQTECAANTAAADINNYMLPYAVYSKSKKGGLAVVFALSADEKDAVKAP